MRLLMKMADGLNQLKDLPPLFFRLVLAYGFFGPFMMKVHGTDGFAHFLQTLGVPAPTFFAWLTMIFEGAGVICLFFGFITRIITIPLIVILANAIFLVHWQNGYNPGENGFAIPLLYGLILIDLLITGPGRISVDAIITGAYKRKRSGHGGAPPPQM